MTSHKILSIDIETYSGIDIENGSYRYSESDDFEILLLGYAWDDGPVETVDICQGEKVPADVISALTDPNIEKHAFNANFERICLSRFLGYPKDKFIPANLGWWCTKIHAAMLGLPGSLKEVAKALNLSEQKDEAGTLLINYFCKPCRATKANCGRTRNYPIHDPDKWNLFKKYNKQDVATERAISHELSRLYPASSEAMSQEKENYSQDQNINDYGVLIDLPMVKTIIDYNEVMIARLTQRAKDVTGLDNPNSMLQLKQWLHTQGVNADQLTKATIPNIVADTGSADVKEVLEIRQQLGKTSVTKYERMRDAACQDSRVRGTLQFYGARTGRWAGRIIQPQNLPQNHYDEIDELRTLVTKREWPYLEMMYDNMSDVFSQLIRTAIIAPEGCILSVADYRSIEARVIAWVAHETWAETEFQGAGNIYEATAAMMFGVSAESCRKGHENAAYRQRGKVATLACGYGGGPEAMARMDIKHQIDPNEYPSLVAKWRKANPHIVALWSKVETATRQAMTEGIRTKIDQIYFEYKDGSLFITLPSGRVISYYKARIDEDDTIRYWGTDVKGWVELHTWGGKLVENIVQSIARDCLMQAILRLRENNYHIVTHVHDEIITEIREDGSDGHSLQEHQDLMTHPLNWASGLYLPTEGYTTKFYKKD